MSQSHDLHAAGKWNTGQLYVQINVQKLVLHPAELIWKENPTMIHDSS